MPFTNGEKRACAEREVKQRNRVYPRLVENGRMTKEAAEREIAMMKEIAEDYETREVSEGERLI